MFKKFLILGVVMLLIAAPGCQPTVDPPDPVVVDSIATSVEEFVGEATIPSDSGDSPVEVVAKSDDPAASSIKAEKLSISFVVSKVNGDLHKLSVVVSGAEDVGPFNSFQWDTVISDSLNFEGVLPGTDGVTNGWAGIMANSTRGHAKYGRVGGYSGYVTPTPSGVLVDMFFRGNPKFIDEVTINNFKISLWATTLPVTSNPRITPIR